MMKEASYQYSLDEWTWVCLHNIYMKQHQSRCVYIYIYNYRERESNYEVLLFNLIVA
jgi:hypothetical protein